VLATNLKADGRGDASVRKVLSLLQSILQRAVEWQRIPVNPVKAVKKPSAKKASRTTAPAPQTIEELRSSLKSKRDKTLVSLMAYASLRPGEALALRWGDVRERTVLVTKAVSLGEEKSTKTGRERSVPLMKPVSQDLNEWKLASGRPGDDALVFPAAGGGLWQDHDYRNWRKRVFKPAAGSLGIARPYDLRHSYASLRFAERANPAEIAEEMGHSLEVLFGTYAHVMADLKGIAAVSAEELILKARSGHISVTSTGNVNVGAKASP
jgi:integrase